MAAKLGRKLLLEWGGEEIPGVREKGINRNGEPVDISSDDDNGWRSLLTEAGQNQVDVSVSGVTKSHQLAADWHAGTRTKTLEVTDTVSGATISGTFYLASYNETGTYNGAVTCEASFQPSGAVDYNNYS